METELIKALASVVEDLTKELKQKQEWVASDRINAGSN